MHRTIYEYISDSPYDVRVARTHPDVTVHDETDAEDPIEDGVVGAARGKRGDGEGYKPCRKNALEGPVVRAV